MIDTLGDRMKAYEVIEAGRMFIPQLPILVRLDGRSFSNYTRKMKRPYDEKMSKCMINTTKRLVKETNAKIGYTQSDEITLLFYSDGIDSQVFFNGKISKMVSTLSALTSVYFNDEIQRVYPEFSNKLVTFDCRAWQVPTKEEACNVFRWREWDAVKNSISMLAQSHFSHKELHGVNSRDKKQMLEDIGVVWGEMHPHFKRGSYIGRVVKEMSFDEFERLPEKHHAITNPELKYTRSKVKNLLLPDFNRIMNPVEVLFENALPVESEL